LGDNDASMFRIPLLTGEPINGASKSSSSKLGKILSSSRNSNLPSSRLGCTCNCQCSSSRESASHPAILKP
jgi:predicted DNA binding protein